MIINYITKKTFINYKQLTDPGSTRDESGSTGTGLPQFGQNRDFASFGLGLSQYTHL